MDEFKLSLPWVERLDMVNAPAPLAPELALQMQEQEVRRAKQLQGNKKLPQFAPSEDPVLNDFKRETMFHRQAQGAVLDGIARLKKMGIATRRPDDYFAEMAKSDQHMQKVRENLMKKQVEAQRSERVRQLRQQRKVGKQMQIESKLKKQADKKQMLDEVKKYRKGVRKDLDFLDDKKKLGSKKAGNTNRGMDKKAQAKIKMKNSKFGFGGKKRGSKQNTRSSAADVSDWKKPGNPKKKGKGAAAVKQRPGKNRRVQMKSRKK